MGIEKLIIAVAIFVSYFLQTSVDFFRLGDIKPDFLLFLTIYFAVYRGDFSAIWIGFFGGFLQDINLGAVPSAADNAVKQFIGINALPKAVIGYYTAKIAGRIRKDNTLTWVGLVFGFSIAKGFMIFILSAMFQGSAAAQSIFTVILPEAIYNSILAVFWFKILHWAIPPVQVE